MQREDLEHGARGPVAECVDIVESEEEVVGHRREHLVAELDRLEVGCALQAEISPETREALPDTGHEMTEERLRGREAFVERTPDNGDLGAMDCLGKEGGLAVARTGDDRDKSPRKATCDAGDERVAGHPGRRYPGREETCTKDSGQA